MFPARRFPRKFFGRRYNKNFRKKKLFISRLPEKKAHDTLISAAFSGAGTGGFLCLNDMAQGTSNATRNGQKINMVSLRISIFLTQDPLNTTWDVYRIMIVYDRQANGAIFATSDLLNNTTGTQTIFSALSIGNSRRFKVLLDKRMRTDTNSFEAVWLNKYLRFNLPVVFSSGNAGTIADISSGSLYLLYISYDSTNTANIEGHFRMRFYDA